MKRNNIIMNTGRFFIAALVSASLFACGDDSTEAEAIAGDIPFEFISDNSAVTLSDDGRQATLEIPSLGGSVAFGVETEAQWTAQIEDEDDWVSVNGSGGDIIISGPEFVSDYTRNAMVRIMTDGRILGYIYVSQAGTEVASLSLDRYEVVFPEMGGSSAITVETNRESWHVEGFDGSGWLEYEIEDGQIILSTVTNEVAYEFSTTFSVVAGSDGNHETAQVSVTLEPWSPAYIRLDRDMVIIPEEGGNLKFGVESNRQWEASTTDTWYTVDKEDGLITIVASPSSSGTLEGFIALETTSGRDKASLDLPIRQYTNPYILEYTVPSDEARIAVPISGNANCYVDWGDGQSTSYSGYIATFYDPQIEHEYATKGTYNVKIYGKAENREVGYGSVMQASAPWITKVISWGDLGAKNIAGMLRLSSIKTLPDGYQNMFKNATAMNSAFSNCLELEEIPADLLNDIQVTNLAGFFYGCSNLKSIPATLLKGATNLTRVPTMFRYCTSLTDIPGELFDECPNLNGVTATFDGCSSVKVVPAGLLANNPEITDVNQLFRDCVSLETLPVDIFDNNKKIAYFDRTFLNCAKLTEAPYTEVSGTKIYLWDRNASNGYVDNISGFECFKGATGLGNYDDIPDGWK